MWRKVFYILFFNISWLTSFRGNAQILNVEKSRLQEDSLRHLIGDVNFSFALNNRSAAPDQRVVYIGLAGLSHLAYYSTKHVYLLIGTINYNSVTGNPFISTGYGHFRINFNRKKRLSEEAFTQIQYDESRGMNYRALAGAGLRFLLFKTKKTELNLGAGLMWETEEWNMPGREDSITVKNIPKSTSYASIKIKLNEHTDFNVINYYQVGYDQEGDVFRHRLNIDASLSFKINKHLSFTNSFSGAYENKPVVPILKFVYSLSNGLIIKF